MASDVVGPSQQQSIRLPSAAPSSATAIAVVFAIAVAALYLGREVLIPLALAILLSFALSPATTLLRRWGLGRVPSVILVVLIVFALVAGFATVVSTQLASLADNLARYEHNFRAKIRAGEAMAKGGGPLKQLQTVWEDIQQELEKSTQKSPSANTSSPGSRGQTGEHHADSGRGARTAGEARADRQRVRGWAVEAAGDHRRRRGVRNFLAPSTRGHARSFHSAVRLGRRSPNDRTDDRRGQARQPVPAHAGGASTCSTGSRSVSACG